ncbi:MAG TPA: helix-turn-helix transcriptional regulator [Blastocatellia bacterium]|nr:helix-turn-helix transcriptional regulator [Blastocatellia bacterium]
MIVPSKILSVKGSGCIFRKTFIRPLMIEFRIREVAKKRGITSAYQLQKAMGIHPGAASRLWNRAEGLNFKTLEAICRTLKCKPGDLFVLKPDPE